MFPISRGNSACPRYAVGGEMSDKDLEQRISIKFCVEFGKSASETLALLTLAYCEYAMKKSSVLNEIGGSSDDEKMCKTTQEVGSRKYKGQTQIVQSANNVVLRSKIMCEANSRGTEYELLFGGRDPNSGSTSGFSTVKMPQCVIC
jgi:hypothetical protein